jgi:hypothetical protein
VTSRRLAPGEQHRRWCERVVDALRACGATEGLPRTALRLLAFGGNAITPLEYDAVLKDLVTGGRIEERYVDHFVGRFGGGCFIYRIPSSDTANGEGAFHD